MSSHSDPFGESGAGPPSTPSPSSSSTSGISGFSPISTLARQYQNQSGRILISVHCNAACCVTLDDVWKARKQGGPSSSSAQNSQQQAPTDLSPLDGISSNGISNMNVTINNTSPEADVSQENPFSFLESESETTTQTQSQSQEPQVMQVPMGDVSSSKKKPNLGRFLKKVAATGTQALERGMHQLAVKADQGKNPDRLVLGVYDTQSDTLLHATEAEPLPSVRSQGLHFRIPLAVPTTATSTITLKLWVRSGAALVASKHYPVAETGPLDANKLRASLAQQQQAQVPVPALFFAVPLLTNPLITDGQLHCTAVGDNKFPPTCGKGWSLQDPNPSTAYSVAAAGMFHLPLDQSYAFTIPNRPAPPPTSTLWATERTVESAIVLPLATAWARMASAAARNSLRHAQSVGQSVLNYRHDSPTGPEYANVQLSVSHFQTNLASSQILQSAKGFPTISVSFQRPNSIFEVELLPPTKLPLHPEAAAGLHNGSSPSSSSSGTPGCQFYPKPVRDGILPAVLNQIPRQRLSPGQFLLGNARLIVSLPRGTSSGGFDGVCGGDTTITPQNPFDAPGTTAPAAVEGESSNNGEVWDCIVPLEAVLQDPSKNGQHQELPVLDIAAGTIMGTMALTLTVQMVQQSEKSVPNVPATGGLVDLVGIPHLTDGVLPKLDCVDCNTRSTATDPEVRRRRGQFATMGGFVTYDYLDYHTNSVRQVDVGLLDERATQYQRALEAAMGKAPPPSEHLPSHQDRTPRPFRPSASRSTVLLSGIGFNVHTASFALDVLDSSSNTTTRTKDKNQTLPGAVFHNITCGAPADHARGFGDVFASPKETKSSNNGSNATPTAAANPTSFALNSPIGPATGGLRRLEMARRNLATQVSNEQMALVMLIQNYFVMHRQQQQQQQQQRGRPVTHVPPRHAELQGMRWKVFEAVQCLHHLTWTCTMRRASVFSQALGIAVSSYLSSISDARALQSTWPETWTRHGYLVSFEGLLSAAGKELGMIEDASVAINMLQNVRVILVPDDGAANPARVPVPHSLYLRWVHLWSVPPQATGSVPDSRGGDGGGTATEYVLQIGIVPSYFDHRIPPSLKNGAAVRFFPLLFEVGVDIFQAASNAGSNMSKNYAGGASATVEPETPKLSLTEDEEDDTGFVDDDVLVQLNYEAFQKMNYYAQAVSPAAPVQATSTRQTHPLLATLFQHIVSSSGKMNHDILDEAAYLAQQLGGGGCVFCKSGKDRTAMHVTYKQAQFETRFRAKMAGNSGGLDEDVDSLMEDTTIADAMLIRLYGTRLPICEKNVGQAKYAFNSLQVKFMPDALKPPMSALAGFLKGGKVFGKGGIES